jgi:hypothetical protein
MEHVRLHGFRLLRIPRFCIGLEIKGDHGLLWHQGGWDPRGGFEEMVTSPQGDCSINDKNG